MKTKKYLTIVLAITISGVFVGCHEDELSGSLIEQKKIAFEDAFIRAFGQPDPTHNWGFRMPGSDESFTRTENANANEWADPDKAYGGLLVPPPLTPEQIAVVKKYFQTHPDLDYEDPQWSNYFIQQVYKGHTDVPQGCATPEQYLAANGSTYIIASDHMDHLIAVDEVKGIYDHINNFNHGDCSENHTVLDNGGNANDGPFHTDKIMYMQNSTTKSFGYHNSDGSLYHTEYTGLVSYKTIMKAMGAEAKCLDDGWNRSFMGFDFEQMVGSSVYEKILDYQVEGGWNAEKWGPDGFPVKGYKTFEFEGKTYNFLNSNTNMYAADRTETSYIQKKGSYSTDGGKANFIDRPSDNIIRDLLSKGYLPYTDTLKDWVKVGGTADGYFSDWIVTLTEAKTEVSNVPDVWQIDGEPGKRYFITGRKVIESGRVMCEDLAGASGNLDDLDYNDIVYDAIIVNEYKKLVTAEGEVIDENYFPDDNKYYATVRLMAAGGTIPVELVIPEKNGKQNFDVHFEFEATDNVMINTLSEEERVSVNGAYVANTSPKTLINKKDGTDKFYGVKYISDITLNVLYDNVSSELVNKYGAATYKFLVPLGTPWAKERIRFDYGYPNYPEWVYDKDYNMDWYNDNVPELLYDNLEGLTIPDNFEYESDPEWYDDNGLASTFSKSLVPATSTMAYPSSSETIIYNFTDDNATSGYLCPKITTSDGTTYEEESLNVAGQSNIEWGQTIRIYGVSINGWYITTNISDKIDQYNVNGNYIDIPVSSSNIDQIKRGITIKGKHFTVTYVTVY